MYKLFMIHFQTLDPDQKLNFLINLYSNRDIFSLSAVQVL